MFAEHSPEVKSPALITNAGFLELMKSLALLTASPCVIGLVAELPGSSQSPSGVSEMTAKLNLMLPDGGGGGESDAGEGVEESDVDARIGVEEPHSSTIPSPLKSPLFPFQSKCM